MPAQSETAGRSRRHREQMLAPGRGIAARRVRLRYALLQLRGQLNNCWGLSRCRRSTLETIAPSAMLSATRSAFSSAVHFRRRSMPVITSTRRRRAAADTPWCHHYVRHYGQNDACSWAGILPAAQTPRNVGPAYRLRQIGWSIAVRPIKSCLDIYRPCLNEISRVPNAMPLCYLLNLGRAVTLNV
jgi:hypothetical protein